MAWKRNPLTEVLSPQRKYAALEDRAQRRAAYANPSGGRPTERTTERLNQGAGNGWGHRGPMSGATDAGRPPAPAKHTGDERRGILYMAALQRLSRGEGGAKSRARVSEVDPQVARQAPGQTFDSSGPRRRRPRSGGYFSS